MISTTKLQNELNSIKDHVIGLFKVRGKFHLVLNHQPSNNTVDTLFITELGAIQKDFNTPVDYGKLKLFKDGKNMNQVLANPFEWSEFIESFDL